MKPALLGPLLTFADAATETKYQLFYAQKRVYFDTIGLYTCLLQLAPGERQQGDHTHAAPCYRVSAATSSLKNPAKFAAFVEASLQICVPLEACLYSLRCVQCVLLEHSHWSSSSGPFLPRQQKPYLLYIQGMPLYWLLCKPIASQPMLSTPVSSTPGQSQP